jgi:hypothetical protein
LDPQEILPCPARLELKGFSRRGGEDVDRWLHGVRRGSEKVHEETRVRAFRADQLYGNGEPLASTKEEPVA